MSDAVTTAKNARESLARGLSALQSDPNIPPHVLELAEPIAVAMGALHQIERSGGQLVPHAETALNYVRGALGQLQAAPTQHPAIMSAMESVAGSLGLVHSLVRLSQAGAGPQAAAAQPQNAPQQGRQATGSMPQQQQQPQQPGFPQPAQQQPHQHQQPPQQQQHYQQAPAQPYGQPPYGQAPATAQPAPSFNQGPTDFVRPASQAFQQPPPYLAGPQPPVTSPSPGQRPNTGQMPGQNAGHNAGQPAPQHAPAFGGGGTVPVTDLPLVNADLGAHSATNFYKGLSGNDIIDHGGLFVSTYKIPRIGSPVRLKVSLPGGYEFEANAVVRWSREASEGGADAPPGFGAQFTEITNEARQLVYRYVRNREPLFHDDL